MIDFKLAKRIIKLALPVIIGMQSQTIVALVDTAMVGRLSAAAIAAVGLGTVAFAVMSNAMVGVRDSTQVLASRKKGQGHVDGLSQVLDNGMVLAIFVSLILTSIGYLGLDYLFQFFSKDSEVISLGRSYLNIRLIGLIFVILNASFYGFFIGIGRPRVFLEVTLLLNVINIILNYILIFGKLGLPALGVNGAAIASVVACAIGSFLYILKGIEFKHENGMRRKWFQKGSVTIDFLRQMFRLAYPGAFRGMLILAGFLVFLSIVGTIGTYEQAASIIMVHIGSFFFFAAHGFGITSGSMTGRAMGSGQIEDSHKYGWETVKIAAGILGSLGFLVAINSEWVLRAFTPNIAVVAVGTLPLFIYAMWQIADACGNVIGFSLIGAGMVRWVSAVVIGIQWLIFLPAVYIVVRVLGHGLVAAWLTLVLYRALVSVVVGIKFHLGGWKRVEV